MTRAVTLLLLLGCLAQWNLVAAARTCAAKWAQYLDGTLTVAINIKRSGGLCEGETAAVVESVLQYSMTCSGEEYAMKVLLQHPVDETRVSVKREPGALAVITLQKQTASTWWSSLAKHPEQFKTLLSRDFGRGDPEPDPEELEEMATEAAAVGADGTATKRLSKKEQMKADAQADWEDALKTAQEQMMHGGKVSPQLIARLKALDVVLPEQSIHISIILGSLQIQRGDTSEGQQRIRRALKQCKAQGQEDLCKGAHQTLAQSMSTANTAMDKKTVAEMVELYRQGAALVPDSYETYYQLGKHLGILSTEHVGGKKDEAAAAFRTAHSLQPDKAEALQMLSMRLSQAPRKKTRQVARKVASKAMKMEPKQPMGHMALGKAYVSQEFNQGDLKPATREKAIKSLNTALELSTAASSGGGDGATPLSKKLYAETEFMLGTLVSPTDANRALKHFRAANELAPREPRFKEALSQLLKGAQEYRKEQKEKEAKAEAARLKRLEDEEDAAWEEDGLAF